MDFGAKLGLPEKAVAKMVHRTASLVLRWLPSLVTHLDEASTDVLRTRAASLSGIEGGPIRYPSSMHKRLYDLPPAEGMPIEVGVLLAALEDSSREWREELEQIPVEGLIWQPFPGGHSVGAVLLHIADVENFWIQEMCLGEKTPPEFLAEVLSKETQQYEVTWPTPPAEPLEWYLAKLDAVRARTREALTRFPDPHGVVGLEKWDFEVTRRWVLAHVVEHDSYHGGQAVLLKLLWERLK